jgi:beta-1,4-mannosyl-glycoprotein beta-1,4-N-acetylglucosaminyltransferase
MVYDCFIFFNELDLLEIRLHTMNEVVDKFVLVEATRTFQGNPKPLHYLENRKRFALFESKIIHVIVDSYPSFFSRWRKPNAWDIEDHQRNQISRGLAKCDPDDIVILSDLDEIPKPGQVKAYANQAGIAVFRQMNFYYFLNCQCVNDSEKWWYGSVMSHVKDFKEPKDLRSISKRMNADHMKILKDKLHRAIRSLVNPIYRHAITIVEDGGWHFGFLGGADKIIEKLEAFAHTEYNKEEFKNKNAVLEAINNGKDLFGRGFEYSFIDLDDSFPPYVIKNKERFKHLIKG